MQNLIQKITEYTFVTPELQKEIESYFELAKFSKNEKILQENSRADYLFFIEKGLLHNAYNHDGKQITSWFYKENQFVTSWSSFYSRKLSFEEIECLEDCILYRIRYSDYQKLITDSPAFSTFSRLLTEEILVLIDEFSKGWSFLSAKDKYILLHSYFPQIELRVKLGLIASFLGISQETLSRIRSGK